MELEQRNGLSAVPTYKGQNVPEQSCANNDVICVITSAIEDNYILIEKLTFQWRQPTGPNPWVGQH